MLSGLNDVKFTYPNPIYDALCVKSYNAINFRFKYFAVLHVACANSYLNPSLSFYKHPIGISSQLPFTAILVSEKL